MTRVALMTHNNGNGGAALAVSRLARGLTINTSQNVEFDFSLLAAIIEDKDFSVTKNQIGGSSYPPINFARIFLSRAIAKTWSIIHKTNHDPRVFCMQGYRDVRLQLQDFDIVNLFWMQTLADLSKLARVQIPKVITLHDMWFLTGGCSYSFGCEKYRSGCKNCDYMWTPFARDSSNQYSLKDKILSSDSTRVVVSSKWMHEIARVRGIDDSKISMIKNYIPDKYHFLNKKTTARSLLDIDVKLQEKIILYFVGAIGDPRKGFDLFYNAISLLPSCLQKEILLMHLGPIDIAYDALLEYFGVNIIHLGFFVDEISQIVAYNAADLLICPSRYDNTPNVVAEAHMCGLPVIGAGGTGAAEMIIEDYNGLLANVNNPEEFAWTLEYAIINICTFSRDAICATAKSTYGLQATCQNYIKLYKSIA